MKAALKTLLFCSALMLLSASPTPARAQVPDEAAPERPEAGARPRGRGHNLMRRLSLTPEQRQRLREIRSRQAHEARELARRLRLARRALDDAIYADALDERLVEQRWRELSAAQAEVTRLRAATELKVRGVLTPEQLRLFRDLRRDAQQRQLLRRRLRDQRRNPGINQ